MKILDCWCKLPQQDVDFVAFRDYNPSALHHYLVIPKRHIDSVKSLSYEDVALVERMMEIGHHILNNLDVPDNSRRMGFHIPPFNSVDHLHLHVQGLPYKSIFRHAKYPVVHGYGRLAKGFSWFSEVTQTIAILQTHGRVKVVPCWWGAVNLTLMETTNPNHIPPRQWEFILL